MDSDIKEQTELGDLILKAISNFKKDSDSRKTHLYLRKRKTHLTELYNQYREADKRIVAYPEMDPSLPYFTERQHIRTSLEVILADIDNRLKVADIQTTDTPNVPIASKSKLADLTSATTTEQRSDMVKIDDAPQSETSAVNKIHLPLWSTKNSANETKQRLFQRQIIKIRHLKSLIKQANGFIQQQKPKEYLMQKIHQINTALPKIDELHEDILLESNESDLEIEEYFLEDMFNAVNEEADHCCAQLQQAMNFQEDKIIQRKKQHSKIELPKIQIPQFFGDYNKWMSFQDIFKKLVHENEDLSDTHKMSYLKAHITGQAAKIISHLDTTGQNYEAAWQIIEARFNNKRLVVTNYVNTILSLQAHTESSYALKTLHDSLNECLHGINNLGVDTSTWSAIIIPIILKKLDSETLRIYESSLTQPREIQPMVDFLEFLEKRFQSLESINATKPLKKINHSNPTKVYATKMYSSHKTPQAPAVRQNNSTNNCTLCQQQHKLVSCEKFCKLSTLEKLQIVNLHELCRCCLSKGHSITKCTSNIMCNECKGQHHSLLHQKHIDAHQPASSTKSTNHSKNTKHDQDYQEAQVLLATAIVEAEAANGTKLWLRVLLDPGSQATFITENAVQRLQLKTTKMHATIAGVGDTEIGQVKKMVNVSLSSTIKPSFNLPIEALVFQKLTKLLPERKFNNNYWNHLNDLQYADPKFNIPGTIDILLGADYYPKVILGGIKKGDMEEPIAQNTEFGWVVFGKVKEPLPKRISTMISYFEIEKQLRSFWEIEEMQPKREFTLEEQECESHYKQNYKRLENGRYEVAIPFNTNNNSLLGESKRRAAARLLQVEKQWQKNSALGIEYNRFLKEYLELQHMEAVVENPSQQEAAQTYYLPHHAVLKAESTTTKLRVVFDASAKSSTGLALNDIMFTGPTLQQELVSILTRWRKHKYAFTADIEKMFRQINVREKDRNFQRILWRDSRNQIQTYRLKTVTYGTASATYLATKTLQQLAHDEELKYPLACKITMEDFYIDDVLSGANTLKGAITAQKQLTSLLHQGGFNLRKWSSNNHQILQNIAEEDIHTGTHTIEFGDVVKTLGVIWDTKQDEFQFKTNFSETTVVPTKRIILSETSKLFDPMGWLAPVIIKAKILMQNLWIAGVSWDQELENHIASNWLSYRQNLHLVEQIKIPRWMEYTENNIGELHGFCDASEHAYAAVVYFKSKSSTTMLMAKTRVAPIKTKISLPRLELCAAVLLAKLIIKIQDALQLPELQVYAWTDSMITLGWIKAKPHRFKTFVANRISEIQSLINPSQWHHVKSEENPADCASRGLDVPQLKDHHLWWKGPDWLRTVNPPIQQDTIEPDDERKPEITMLQISTAKNYLMEAIERFSTFTKAVRVVAYVIRFTCKRVKACHQRKTYLTSEELNRATTTIIKLVQSEEFSKEIQELKNKKLPESNISSLNPFLDEKGVIRVGGRLANASLDYNCKHPIIIPYRSHFTKLVINHAHKTTLHGSKSMTLAFIRQHYWIIKGPMAVKNNINQCVICHKHKKHTLQQLMGHLPHARTTPTRPFTHTGVDYAGPIQLRISKGRGCKSYKGYIAIFVCFAVKAIHIEVVSDMTAEAFIAAFKRFTARRGHCSDIYSDCGTNFVGADRIMQRNLVKTIQTTNEAVAEILANEGTTWHFIPPAAPHMGGIWEGAVKSTKYHLKRVIGERTLTYEELTTILNQIEACLNSRPLAAMSSDPNDINILTPGHFLIGGPLIVPPEPSNLNYSINSLKRWDLVRRITQDFWKAWLAEYVLSLQRRRKWTQEHSNIAIGELVLVKDDNIPPGKWPLARVIDVHPGIDKHVRVVTLKGAGGSTLKRPITKISPLPTEDNEKLRESLEQTGNESNSDKVYNRKTSTSLRPKTIYAPLIILAILIDLCSASATYPFNITKFYNEPGLYFEYIGDLKFTNNNWNIIVYYNLTNYYAELEAYRRCIVRMENFCSYSDNNFTNSSIAKGARKDICALINPQFQHTLLEMEHRDELLHNNKVKFGRTKRAILNIVGNVASDLFGVLDDRDAARYQREIENLQMKDDRLLELMKNQTTIIDATVNMFKKREEDIDQHWKMFKNQIADVLEASDSKTNLLTLSIHTLLLMISFKETQDTLIEAVLDTHNRVISTKLLTTHQLKNELDIITRNMPEDLMLPTVKDMDDILALYQIMTSKSKLKGNYLIFELKIPLVYKEQYQIFKLIPLPTTSKPSVFIQPKMEFLITNLHKDSYYSMSNYEWQQCAISNEFSICKLNHVIYHHQDKDAICELQLLRQETVNSKCQIVESISSDPVDTWIQLQDHRWLYSVQEERLISIVCQQRPFSAKLSHSGILYLADGCALKEKSINIPARRTYNNKVYASLLPTLNLSTAAFERRQERPIFGDLAKLEGVKELQQRIKEEIVNEANTLSHHHIHHYALIYGTLSTLIIVVTCFLVMEKIRRRSKKRYTIRKAPTVQPLEEITAV